jgi:hypothetical protein
VKKAAIQPLTCKLLKLQINWNKIKPGAQAPGFFVASIFIASIAWLVYGFAMKRASFILQGLVLLAFMAGGVIPAGFMPGQGAGSHSLVICSGAGLKTIHVPADKQPPSQGHDHQCPYALALAKASVTTGPVLPFVQVVPEQPAHPAISFISYFINKSYLSQGPPFFPA